MDGFVCKLPKGKYDRYHLIGGQSREKKKGFAEELKRIKTNITAAIKTYL